MWYTICVTFIILEKRIKKKKKATHTHWHFRSIPINWTEKGLLVPAIRILHLILHFCYVSLHLPIINNSLISCASIFVVNILWCTSFYFLDTSYTLWRWSHKVTIFLVKSKATCLRAWSIWFYMKCFDAEFSHGLSGPQTVAEGSFSLGNRQTGSFLLFWERSPCPWFNWR